MTANRQSRIELARFLEEKHRRYAQRKIEAYYPETGPLSRHRYPKHMQVFEAGKTYLERCMMSANRVGKSEGVGAYEVACHATGIYPDWWSGRKFDRPISAWAAGTTGTTARDIVQYKLIGTPDDMGTGMILGNKITKTTPKAGGVPNAVDTIYVRHVTGGVSRIKIKSYAEGRKSFEGTEQDMIWLDEECPLDIYMECLTRTMGIRGSILLTFTPLEGLTETVLLFMPGGKIKEKRQENRVVIMATWDDAPHLSKEERERLWSGLPVYQQEARSKGIPQLGSGAIYPIAESDFLVRDFALPPEWPRAFGMDVGWNKTAAVWGAWDREADCVYLYSEYYKGKAEPVVHAAGINARGKWIPGMIDPASRGRGQRDGKRLFKEYQDLGLNIHMAYNAVEAGIHAVYTRLSTGRMKVFKSLVNWLSEYRIYRRDEDGKVVKKKDHLMDGTKYLTTTGLEKAIVEPPGTRKSIAPTQKGRKSGWAR